MTICVFVSGGDVVPADDAAGIGVVGRYRRPIEGGSQQDWQGIDRLVELKDKNLLPSGVSTWEWGFPTGVLKACKTCR